MIVKRFYNEELAQASYLIGCAATGEALVVDANRDVEQYVRMAEAEGVRITHVTETHIHADFVSGSRELAQRVKAQLYLSGEGGRHWQYDFAGKDGATLLHHGDRIQVGNIRIDVLHTPGHTPEHLSFLVTDGAAADRPIAAVTGDFVFVGDVGRPDLLEKAAGVEGTMEDSARTLFRSLQTFKQQPDYLQIWPGHGAGSACGKGLSSIPTSTVGYERLFNWAFGIEEEGEFVQAVLAGQPEPPRYFARMKHVNREGPPLLGGFARPRWTPESWFERVLTSGARIVDTRAAPLYASAHIPGTINIPFNQSFATWAGWLLSYEEDFYLIVDDRCGTCLEEVARHLALIGLDRIGGYFSIEVLEQWKAQRGELQAIPQATAEELRASISSGSVAVLDVREPAEWEAGHLPESKNIPVGLLEERLAEVPRDRPVIVHCQGGARSAIAASLLHAHGMENVRNLTQGYQEWIAGGHPVEKAPADSPGRAA